MHAFSVLSRKSKARTSNMDGAYIAGDPDVGGVSVVGFSGVVKLKV